MTFELRGGPQFEHAGRVLEEEAAGLQHRVGAALRAAIDPPRVAREGAEDLPAGNGLRARVQRYRASLEETGDEATLRIERAAGYNAGHLRHPVYGNHDVMVSQRVPAGGFDRAFEHAAERAEKKTHEALDDLAADVARKA